MKNIFLLLFPIVLLSCEREYDNMDAVDKIVLPPYTETGANSFGFLFNNKVFINFGKSYSGGISPGWSTNRQESVAKLDGNSYTIFINGRKSIVQNSKAIEDYSADLQFVPIPPYVQKYELFPDQFIMRDMINSNYYNAELSRPITVELNKFQKVGVHETIVSGKFYGTVFNTQNPLDSLVITDGRFDVKVLYAW